MEQSSFVDDSHGRHKNDFYRTPSEVTRALCDEFKLRGIDPKTILDVGCGDGAIGSVVRAQYPRCRIDGIELDHGRWWKAYHLRTSAKVYDAVGEGDFANDYTWQTRHCSEYDLIVSNPPFKFALQFMKLALQRVRSGGHVAFLLISQYDQETVHDDERGRFLDSLRKADGSEGYGQLKYKGRIDFRGDGNGDRVAYKWLVIGPGFEGSFVRVPRSPMGGSEQLTMGIT